MPDALPAIYPGLGQAPNMLDCIPGELRPVFGRLPEPNRAWLLFVYFSRQASQLLV